MFNTVQPEPVWSYTTEIDDSASGLRVTETTLPTKPAH